MRDVALVTGANRGVGLATVRALCKKFNGDVVLTSRNKESGLEAVDLLKREGLNPVYHHLDVASYESVEAIRKYILQQYGGINVLVNNAAIAYRADCQIPFFDQARETVAINFTGALDMSRAFIPMLRPHGRIVNVSSGVSDLKLLSKDLKERFMSSVEEEEVVQLLDEFLEAVKAGNEKDKGWPSWPNAVSKIGMNALTRIHARKLAELQKEDILVNACCPGWVRTNMADDNAPLSPDEGAETPVYLALLPSGSPTGHFWINKEIIDWNEVSWTYYDPSTYKY